MKRIFVGMLVMLLAAGTGVLFAQAQQQAAAPQTAGAAPTSGVRAEYLANLNAAADHEVRLAGAIPAEKYTWRPGEGVRSVSEVLLHIAAGNYAYSRRLGVNPPAGVTLGPDFEKSTTDKEKVIEMLKQSIDIARQAATQMASDADVEKTVQAGNRQITYRQLLFTCASHNHEHLGQLIAYARVNGIVPPWTEEQQQQQRQQQPPKKSP